MPEGVFRAGVVTPEAALYTGPANGLVLRSSDGDLTVLDGHTTLVTDVVPGEVRIDLPEGDPVRLAVHGGYLHVETAAGLETDQPPDQRTTRATLLAGVAELAQDIDVERARRAAEAARGRIEELRTVAGRGERTAMAGAGAEAAATGAGEPGAALSPEEAELVAQEDALERAEVRLAVAGAEAG